MIPMISLALLALVVGACAPLDRVEFAASDPPTEQPQPPPQTTRTMKLQVGSTVFSIALASNAAAEAFAARLPLAITMNETNGNEKYYYLPRGLPTAAERLPTIRQGDLMLFGSECLVVFYKTFSNSYRYTPIGRIDNPEGLEAALGTGSVAVTFSL